MILVGNSYAGMVITGVAATAPERLRLLVYLDAYIPDEGQNEFDLLPPEARAARQADAAAHGGLMAPHPPGIFGVTDHGLLKWINERMTLQPLATYTEPIPAGSAKSAAIRRVFIHCTEYPPSTPRLFDASAPGKLELPAGPCMNSRRVTSRC